MSRTRIGLIAVILGSLMVFGCKKRPQDAQLTDLQLVDSEDGKGMSAHFSITFNGGPVYDTYVPVEVCINSASINLFSHCLTWEQAVEYATTSGISADEPPPEGSPVTFSIPLAQFAPDTLPAGSDEMPLEVYALWDYQEVTGYDDRAMISLSPWLDDGARLDILSATVTEGTGGAYMTVEFAVYSLSNQAPEALPHLAMQGQAINQRFEIPWADIAQRDNSEASTATNVPLGESLTINFPVESYLLNTVSVYEGSSITASLDLILNNRRHDTSTVNFDSLYDR